ncbi:2-isopropylmalate synthase [Candidatus Woesearchaeota archaeon]|nr:2-isopropylmalate synthase [Candidatus Woesearchaeota archaeon]HIH38342.1 2-isopropylmalate synthase [Candidatus Woesearchaeota archaeon]HIH49661.1 2-isopropylmalate synthase [Candidatus Woesearchaeota archaeon]HIJ03521.1 2-isopropylmalate synthase [Candidatus Woesearchaeota archaeon]
MEQIYIFDTTLRDGEQSPGAAMITPEKLAIARELARAGVDVIEAGFPISSPKDFEAVQTIAREVEGPQMAGLARVRYMDGNWIDIDRAWEAVRDASSARLHLFIGTSPFHVTHKFGGDYNKVRRLALEGVEYAVSLTQGHPNAIVEFSPEDGTRTERRFLAEIVGGVIERGAGVINVPDTVGSTNPRKYQQLLLDLYQDVPALHNVILSVHCHDDFGLAVANSLAGVEIGARQVECTINGLGERAGNAALEEIVANIREGNVDAGPYTVSFNAQLCQVLSQMVATAAGYSVPRNKAIVGRNAFAHEAGIHQHGVIKDARTYEIMDPNEYGAVSELTFGRRSGTHGLRHKLDALGIPIDEQSLQRWYDRAITIADTVKETYADLFHMITDDTLWRDDGLVPEIPSFYELEWYAVHDVNSDHVYADVHVRNRSNDGLMQGIVANPGPIDSIFTALNGVVEVPMVLEGYQIHSIGPGKQAQALVQVKMRYNGFEVLGQGVDQNSHKANILAYLDAANRMTYIIERRRVMGITESLNNAEH